MLYTTEYLATLGKVALRELCRSHNIAYASLNVDSMREALAAVPMPADGAANDAANAAADIVVADATTAALVALDGIEVANVEPVPPTVEGAPFVVLDPPTFAPPRDAAAVFAANPKPTKAAKVRKVREPRDEANGVKRPAAETLCGRVWSWCDTKVAEGVRPEAADLRAALVDIDPTTCTVQYYRWRKFNGIRGR